MKLRFSMKANKYFLMAVMAVFVLIAGGCTTKTTFSWRKMKTFRGVEFQKRTIRRKFTTTGNRVVIERIRQFRAVNRSKRPHCVLFRLINIRNADIEYPSRGVLVLPNSAVFLGQAEGMKLGRWRVGIRLIVDPKAYRMATFRYVFESSDVTSRLKRECGKLRTSAHIPRR